MRDVEQAIACRRIAQYRTGGDGEHRRIVAQARSQVERAVEEGVVDYVRVIKNARAAADYSLAVTAKIPGEAGLRGEKVGRAVDLSGQILAELGQLRRARQVVVGKVAVEVITQPEVEREVRFDLPGVLRIQAEAVVEETAERQVVRRFLAGEAQAVAEHDLTEREVERVARPAEPVGGRDGFRVEGGADARRVAKEAREAICHDVVIRSAEAESMVTFRDAGVVFYLLVVLKGRLGSVRIRADRQLALNVDQDGGASRVERRRRPCLRIPVHNGVVEVEIAVAQRVRPTRGVVICADYMKVSEIGVGERRQIVEAKSGHTDIVIVVEAVEALQVLCNVEIEASADIRLAQRHREVLGEFRERRDGGKLLAVLPGAFTLHMPEEAILEDIAA